MKLLRLRPIVKVSHETHNALKHSGFVALATLILGAERIRCIGFSVLMPGPCILEVMTGITRIVTNLPLIEINDDISDDAVKWVGTLGNLTRFVDQYLALEQAYSPLRPGRRRNIQL